MNCINKKESYWPLLSCQVFLASKPAPIYESKFKNRQEYQLGSLSHFINAKVNEFYFCLKDFIWGQIQINLLSHILLRFLYLILMGYSVLPYLLVSFSLVRISKHHLNRKYIWSTLNYWESLIMKLLVGYRISRFTRISGRCPGSIRPECRAAQTGWKSG